MNKAILICQSRTCKSCGSAAVLKAFKDNHYLIPDVDIVGSGCLGQCGNGPMVLVLPQEVWYNKVHPKIVKTIIEQHLIAGKPVISLLYRVKHP